MTDVQVSNARRIGFTALATRAYWMACNYSYDIPRYYVYSFSDHPWEHVVAYHSWWIVPALLAPIPLALLSLSVHNSPINLRDRRILRTGIMILLSVAFACLLGEHDADTSVAGLAGYADENGELSPGWAAEVKRARHHEVSWFLLLPPIILTTAFVIFGAWRRAVRGADVEAVGEDE
jgi:hypothetical protein